MKKYHLWAEDKEGGVMLIGLFNIIEEIQIKNWFFDKDILFTITYEEEDYNEI